MKEGVLSVEKIQDLKILTIEPSQETSNSLGDAIKCTVTIKGYESHGSGFFIGKNYIITNYHVVEGETNLSGITHDGTSINLRVIRFNEDYDLALLETDSSSNISFSLELITDSLLLGTEIATVGTPISIELRNSVTRGIVSGLRTFDGRDYYQIDSSVNPGNSGGPLIDSNGILFGVVSNKLVEIGIEGIGFAIPSRSIKPTLKIEKQE